jgi:hypothetical protein
MCVDGFQKIVKPIVNVMFDSKKTGGPGKFFCLFNDKVSQEEHTTISSGLRISDMALSSQSDLPAFFSPGKSI